MKKTSKNISKNNVYIPTMFKTYIVSNSRAQIVDMGDWQYIYIPMSGEEQAILKPNITNPCWRIRVENKE